MSSISPTGVGTPRIPAGTSVDKAQADDGGTPASSVNYPRVDEDALARRIFSDEYERTPGKAGNVFKWMGIGAAVLGVAGVGLGILAGRGGGAAAGASSGASALKMALGLGTTGAVIGGLGGLGVGLFTNRRTPEKARDWAAESLDMDARSRPPMPPASAVPSERIGMPGVVKDGISGSTVGGIVRLRQEVMGDVTTRSTTTRNSAGEPTIVIGGNASGETITTETVVRTENAQLNSVGLGRVLYDPKGYDSMSEATEAYDGKHAAAIVKDADRYFLVDVDAESWSALSDRSYAMSLADDRVKAVFANKGVYFPSSIGAEGDGPRLFMFAQEQDIDQTIPTALQEMRDQPIGTYETNAVPGRNRFAERFQVHVDNFHPGDQYSGPGWTDRSEAIQHMVSSEGQQALVKSGDRYYVADLSRRDGRGEAATLDEITHETPQGSAILGLRTNALASDVELIEDAGGLYAPVDDWWSRVRTAE